MTILSGNSSMEERRDLQIVGALGGIGRLLKLWGDRLGRDSDDAGLTDRERRAVEVASFLVHLSSSVIEETFGDRFSVQDWMVYLQGTIIEEELKGRRK